MNLFDDVKRIRKASEAVVSELVGLAEDLARLEEVSVTQTALLRQLVALLTPTPEPPDVVGLDVVPNPPVDR